MTYAKVSMEQSLGRIPPFDQLPLAALEKLASSSQMLRYRIGQPMLRRESMPHQLVVILEGKGRLLGYDPYQKNPMTLELLQPESVLGLAGLVRGLPCESAIASSEVVAIAVPITMVRQLMGENARFAEAINAPCYLAEIFDLASQYFKTQARNVSDLAGTARQLQQDALVAGVGPGQWKAHVNTYGVDNFVVEVRYGSMQYQRPHNDFLWVAAESGIPGLMLLLALLLGAAAQALRHWQQTGSALGLALLAGIMVYVGAAMFSFPRERIAPTLLLCVYLGTALWLNASASTKPMRFVWPLVALLAAGITGWMGLKQNEGGRLEQEMQAMRRAQRFDAAARVSQRIQRLGFTLDRTGIPLVYYEAETLLDKGQFEPARPLLNQALEHNPGHLFSWANLGNIAFKAGDLKGALYHYDHLLALSPRMEEVLMNRSAALYRLGRYEEGMATLKQVRESITTDRYDQLNQALQKALREQRKVGNS